MPSHAKVTEAAAERFKAPEKGQVDHFDKQYPGLSLRVSCGGRKSWTYTYRFRGKLKRLTLGLFPATMNVAQTHDAWRQARRQVEAGQDPGQRVERGATGFEGVFEEWLRRDQAENRSRRVVEYRIRKYALPKWKGREITDIKRRDVLDVVDAIADRGTIIMARRVHGHLHRLFAWSVGRGIIETNPMANMDRPGSETKRERVLTDEELVKVWKGAGELGQPYASLFKLLILTGARRDEIGQLLWSEIANNRIELDGLRTKNGQPHFIPLSTPARLCLEQIPRIAGSDVVFTYDGKRPLNSWTRVKAQLDKASGVSDWRIHDLRRTAATGLQKLGTPLQVTEAVLGHTAGSRGGIVGIYQRHDYADEKRAALEAWGALVTTLVEGRYA
jgi:integrase